MAIGRPPLSATGLIEAAATADAFEQAMSDLLAELHTSHFGFFHSSARRASSRAALSATYLEDETPYGKRWIFQDVHSGGAASIAGIEPGDILLTVDGREIIPPEHPGFSLWASRPRWKLSTATIDDVPSLSMWPGPKGRSFTSSNQRLSRRGNSRIGLAT